MEIIIDTREQKPYKFEFAPLDVKVVKETLKTGDYSIKGFEDQIIVERKSLSDLFGTVGQGRKRFEKELERMSKIKHAFLVIEADWTQILRHPPTRSKLNPKSVFGSIIAWEQRFNIHIWTCPNRAFAERVTFRILERFHSDREKEIL